MMVYSPLTTPAKHVVHICDRVGRQMCCHVHGVAPQLTSKSCCFYFHSKVFQPRYVAVTISRKSLCSSATTTSPTFQGICLESGFSKQRNNSDPLMVKSLVGSMGHKKRYLGIPLPCQNMSLKLSLSKQEMITKIRWNRGSVSWLKGTASAGAIFGLSICFSSSEPVYCEASREKNNENDDHDSSSVGYSHGKKVYTDYSITGIPGDGRCLFRSVAHGACLRSGKPSPSESLQRELADELRARVADEFVRRREETEWFVEGDFDTDVSRIRKPHVWGGEPELFMASHVLQMPITVYMHDENAGGLITIAEYGQEYGKEDPIRVLYHGFGHYDALQIPSKRVSAISSRIMIDARGFGMLLMWQGHRTAHNFAVYPNEKDLGFCALATSAAYQNRVHSSQLFLQCMTL